MAEPIKLESCPPEPRTSIQVKRITILKYEDSFVLKFFNCFNLCSKIEERKLKRCDFIPFVMNPYQ